MSKGSCISGKYCTTTKKGDKNEQNQDISGNPKAFSLRNINHEATDKSAENIHAAWCWRRLNVLHKKVYNVW